MGMKTLLYLKWIINRVLLYITWKSAQCYMVAWMWGRCRGEWIHVYVLLSPFPVHLKLSQHCLLIAYAPIQKIVKELEEILNKSLKRNLEHFVVFVATWLIWLTFSLRYLPVVMCFCLFLWKIMKLAQLGLEVNLNSVSCGLDSGSCHRRISYLSQRKTSVLGAKDTC